MSRSPHPICITQQKVPGTIRIFVFGESAAYGDPQPRFGLPRLLKAMLELRHPTAKFETVNAAMTGINSHAIVPIAHGCSRAGGDVWVIYMGNNEVVGPFGAGTVFGPQAPPAALVRASLTLKALRIGQLLDSVFRRLRPPPPSKSEWGGMQMFLNNQIRETDPAMGNVYRNFERNLADIIRAGRASGARVVVSTVAVNLKDCAPFASKHRADLSAAQLTDWEKDFKTGLAAQLDGKTSEAQLAFNSALAIDDSFAELRFRLGQCALALGDASGARSQFATARDLDTLRFRCDSRLNDLIRRAAANRERDNVLCADAEHAFATASPDGLPGASFFYEHVHLTFEGNYVLARCIAEQVEKLLPEAVRSSSRRWPEISQCAQRLGHTGRDDQLALSEILGRLTDPPFAWQMNHTEQVKRLVETSRNIPPADSPASLKTARAACEKAIAASPDDALLYQQLAELSYARADYVGAVSAAEHAADLLPSNSESWSLLGLALAQQEKYEKATAAFRHVFALDPEDVWGRQNLAICLRKLGQRDAAIREFKQALAIKPRFGLAWLGMGEVYEDMGRNSEAASCYQKALANPVHRAEELAILARFCRSRKWFEAAATNYLEAIQLSPSDPTLLLEAGEVLAALNRHADAAQCFAAASQLLPDSMQAHFLWGLQLGQLGKPAEAEREFREAARCQPDLVEAWLNLGIALYQQQKFEQAIEIFDKTLQMDPANPTALKYVRLLRDQTSKPLEK